MDNTSKTTEMAWGIYDEETAIEKLLLGFPIDWTHAGAEHSTGVCV